MKLCGQRTDGVVMVEVGAHAAVLVDLRRQQVSRQSFDVEGADRHGPWHPAQNTPADVRYVQRVMDAAKQVSLDRMSLDAGTLSYDQRRAKLQAALEDEMRRRYGGPPVGALGSPYWVRDVWDDYIVYGDYGGQLFKWMYLWGENETPVFVGEPMKTSLEYVP